MKSIKWFILIIGLLIFLTPTTSLSAPDRRTALVIGNGAYKSSPLRNPVNDATDIANAIRNLGFSVILKTNANQRTMEDSIRDFGKKLRLGGVGLFYFAGHGLQVEGRNYLIPINANIETESDVRYEAVDAGRVLGKMEDAGNNLNLVILDACRDNPFARSFRTSSQGLAQMDAPKGSLIAYATAPGSVAADGEGRNGIYTKYLLKYISNPNLKVEEVLKQVRLGVINETDEKQIPWESSSLTGDFYFVSKRGIVVAQSLKAKPQYSSELEKERKRLEHERQELERLKMEIEREKLVEERKRLEAEKKKLLAKPKVIERDGRSVAYDNGTVIDTKTGLMWAAKDNGEDINWNDAKRYCENYRGGGYTNWRMPTYNELAGLYDKNRSGYAPECSDGSWKVHITKLIHITCCCPWASDIGQSVSRISAAYLILPWLSFLASPAHFRSYGRALPVRGGKSSFTKTEAKEIGRDGTLIAYATGIVYDKKTGLEWIAGPDRDTTWYEAESWVENLNVAGGGWRMPTRAELKTLYQKGVGTRNMTPLLKTTGWWVWSGETKSSSSAWRFNFYNGDDPWFWRAREDYSYYGIRGFAVRSQR